MERQYQSIFNDVLGPVMNGPSSSHSAGCGRIGLTARQLYGKEITHADVVFEEKGSYPSTFVGQGSNFGFTGGLLGMTTDDPRLKDAVEIAKEQGRRICFKKDDLGFHHPNEAEIRVYAGDRSEDPAMTLLTYSIGGGMFKITKMDGFDIDIDGGTPVCFVCTETEAAKETVMAYLDREKYDYRITEKTEDKSSDDKSGSAAKTVLFDIDVNSSGDAAKELSGLKSAGDNTKDLSALEKHEGVRYVRTAAPVLPVVKKKKQEMPFFYAKEALEYIEKNKKSLAEAAADYECAFGNIDIEGVKKHARYLIGIMRRSTEAPDPENTKKYGILPYIAKNMQEKKNERLVDTGLIRDAVMAAVSVMENNNAHNIVVAAPTAGSSGIIPGAVVTLGDRMGVSEERLIDALLVSGLVGVFIANQATFGAEVAACQAEIGASAAMAAAGVACLIDCTPEQCFNAASMALQNMMGLICDPVGGLTDIPCISRNASAVSNAIVSANLSKLGFDAVIPLDETIQTMGRVGSQLPAELRCTCEGGICVTDTGCRIQKELDEKRPVL